MRHSSKFVIRTTSDSAIRNGPNQSRLHARKASPPTAPATAVAARMVKHPAQGARFDFHRFRKRRPNFDQRGNERDHGKGDQRRQSHQQRHERTLEAGDDSCLEQNKRERNQEEHRLAGTMKERGPMSQRRDPKEISRAPVFAALQQRKHGERHHPKIDRGERLNARPSATHPAPWSEQQDERHDEKRRKAGIKPHLHVTIPQHVNALVSTRKD